MKKTITKIRKDKHIKQLDIAKALGITTMTMRKFENGVTIPSVMQMLRICELLGVNLKDVDLSIYEEHANERMGGGAYK